VNYKLLIKLALTSCALIAPFAGVRAIEASGVEPDSNPTGEPFDLNKDFSINEPFPAGENVSFALESQAEADEADQLAKKLNNPISSLISVPFQANEDWDRWHSGIIGEPNTAGR
jgi:hypothetical protein